MDIQFSSWAVAAVGAGLCGAAILEANQNLASYQNANSQSAFDSARSNINGMNTLYQVGLGALATSLVTVIIDLIILPTPKAVHLQVQKNYQQVLDWEGTENEPN